MKKEIYYLIEPNNNETFNVVRQVWEIGKPYKNTILKVYKYKGSCENYIYNLQFNN
tara:strand:+ start:11522 stop:11689 length:168 start_codon:yes stop_codon:yes gene_type:complete